MCERARSFVCACVREDRQTDKQKCSWMVTTRGFQANRSESWGVRIPLCCPSFLHRAGLWAQRSHNSSGLNYRKASSGSRRCPSGLQDYCDGDGRALCADHPSTHTRLPACRSLQYGLAERCVRTITQHTRVSRDAGPCNMASPSGRRCN